MPLGNSGNEQAASIRFMLGGAQKGGTTALARYLMSHPGLALPRKKEAHVFDAPRFDERWDVSQIDERFAAHFDPDADDRMKGDATPITMFHPTLVARVARYNPAMRWLILLRDPVERAISHYFMERGRGKESLSLLGAVLFERRRLSGHEDDWSAKSPLRVCSYAARSRYAAQLAALYAHFPREQVLVLRSSDLDRDPGQVASQVTGFLGVAPHALPGRDRVFAGTYRTPSRFSPGRLALRWTLRGEKRALARIGVELEPVQASMRLY